MSEATALLHIPLRQIEANPVALREVDAESEEFEQLVDSVRQYGVLNPINVMPALLPDGKTQKTLSDGSPVYRLVDGLHRTAAGKEVGLETIPAQVLSTDHAKAMIQQLIGNCKRIETKPFEYSGHLVRILSNDPTRTKAELASELCVSTAWLDKRLGLAKLHLDIGALVDAGKITVTNACELAKLQPQNEQLQFVEQAMTEQPQVFTGQVKARIKEINDAKRAARNPNVKPEFVAIPHVRRIADLKQELASPSAIPALIKSSGVTDPVTAGMLILQWVLHMDPGSIAEGKAKEEARRKAADDVRAKAKEEREKRRQDEAYAKAAAVGQTFSS